MSYYTKYLKYKNKYLALKNQSAGNPYAAKQYIINEDGTTHQVKLFQKSNKTIYESIEAESATDREINRISTPYYEHSHIMDVYFEKKVCSLFSVQKFRDSIARFRLDRFLEQIIPNCLSVTFSDTGSQVEIIEITTIDTLRNDGIILYFADRLSLELYLQIMRDHTTTFIPTDDLKTSLYRTLGTYYSPDIFGEHSYRFHILHGILFSYDIKDIYGYLREYKDISDSFHRHTQTPSSIPNYITTTEFFELLTEIVQIILSYRTPTISKCVLFKYTEKINSDNLGRPFNFNPIHFYPDRTTSSLLDKFTNYPTYVSANQTLYRQKTIERGDRESKYKDII